MNLQDAIEKKQCMYRHDFAGARNVIKRRVDNMQSFTCSFENAHIRLAVDGEIAQLLPVPEPSHLEMFE